MIRTATCLAALAAALSSSAAAAAEPSDHFSLAKVCVPDPATGKSYLDLDKVACAAAGFEKRCETDPMLTAKMRTEYFRDDIDISRLGDEYLKYDTVLWKQILDGNRADLKVERLSDCASGEIPREGLAGATCARITCQPPPPPEEPSAASQLLERVILRSSADELWPGLEPFEVSRALQGKAAPASLSLHRDLRGDGDSFTAQAALGLVYTEDLGGDGNNPIAIIPYVALERTEHEDQGRDDVTNLSLGGRLIHETGPTVGGMGWSHRLELDFNALSDEEAESFVLDGSFIWSPMPNYEVTQGYWDFDGKLPLRLRLEGRAIGEFGHVVDDGGRAELRDEQDYLRVGGEIGFHLLGPGPASDGLSLSGAYRYLYGIEGPVANFSQLSLALRYAFPATPNFGLELKYFDGRLDTSLDKSETLTAGFTLKF